MRLIRHGQVTLPAEARKTLQLQDGDYLEARVADGELWRRPVDVIARCAANRLPEEASSEPPGADPGRGAALSSHLPSL